MQTYLILKCLTHHGVLTQNDALCVDVILSGTGGVESWSIQPPQLPDDFDFAHFKDQPRPLPQELETSVSFQDEIAAHSASTGDAADFAKFIQNAKVTFPSPPRRSLITCALPLLPPGPP